MGQHVVEIGVSQQGHGGEVVVQGGAAGRLVGVGNHVEVGAPLLRTQVVDGAQDEVRLRPGADGRCRRRIQVGHAELQPQPEGEARLAGRQGLPVLGAGPVPVIGPVGAAVLVQKVAVVGDAQLVQPGPLRRGGDVRHGGVAVEGHAAVGVVIGEIHNRHLGEPVKSES